MTDYWLNKLIFDLQEAGGRGLWTDSKKRLAFVDGYKLSPAIRKALIEDDFTTLQPAINPYLMRNFLLFCGLDDEESKDVLHGLHVGPQPTDKSGEVAHG
ncbi:MAG: hypothetical protein O3C34_04890 [Proteobacteria bacterium]|nr:hypothetical protein [Pseudomonadota bacterium]